MTLPRKLSMLAVLSVSMLAVADQPFNLRPGLWKTAVTLDVGGGEQAQSRTSCITAEDIRSARMLQMSAAQGRSCSSEVTRQTASVLEGVVTCEGPAAVSRWQVSFTASSPTRFTGTMRATGAMPIGITMEGEWMGAACPAGGEEAAGEG